MLESLIYNFGYLGLLVVAFIAATLFPLGSEAFVILMLSLGYDPWLILFFATAGNYAGSVTNYWIGKYGARFFMTKYVKTKKARLSRAERIYAKYGAPSLLLSWVPIIGDPLCIVPGALNLRLRTFSIFVIIGKFVRYCLVIGLANLFM